MPCSFCREDCRDSGGRFASTASILCRKTPGGGTIARFSMQFARAARPGGNPGAPAAVLAAAGGSRRMSRVRGARVSCRPCSCGRQPGCAEAFLSASFVFPSLLSRFRRGSGRPSKGRVWAGLRVRENPRFLASNPRSGTERAHPGALRSAFIANRIRRPGLFPGAGTLLRRERAGCVPERGFVAKNRRFSRTERRLFGRRELERRA